MNDSYIFVLGILLCVVVVPIWLKLHYADKERKLNRNVDDSVDQTINELTDLADNLAQRITNLESILDAETPNWRSKYE